MTPSRADTSADRDSGASAAPYVCPVTDLPCTRYPFVALPSCGHGFSGRAIAQVCLPAFSHKSAFPCSPSTKERIDLLMTAACMLLLYLRSCNVYTCSQLNAAASDVQMFTDADDRSPMRNMQHCIHRRGCRAPEWDSRASARTARTPGCQEGCEEA